MNSSAIPSEEVVRLCVERGELGDWQEFLRRFHPLIQRTVIRVARRWGEVSLQACDDLVQDTYLKLCADNFRILRQFTSRHPDAIYGYLKVVTANAVQDQLRARLAEKRGAHKLQVNLEGDDEIGLAHRGASSPQDIERRVLLQQIDQMLSETEPSAEAARNLRIFWLYFRQGLTAQAIASQPSIGLTVKGVESTLHRMTGNIRAKLAERRTSEKDSAQSAGFQPGKPFS